jgi:aspartate aminotransferase
MKAAHPPMTQRLQAVDESRTTNIFGQARQMRRQGKTIINLAVGEPDFETPMPVIDATRQALAAQATRYGAVAGMETLRSELATAFNGYGPDNILIANGAKQALYGLFQALCDPGAEVILPRPCWVSFTEQIKLAGGRPVLVDTVDHQLDPDAIERAVTERTRIVLVNTPNNPSGAVYSTAALEETARIAHRHGLYLIADEAYEAFVFDDRRQAPLFELCRDRQRLITVRSFSKTYAMTGFRIGYVAGPEGVVRGLLKLQSHLSGNVCTFAQHGALAALKMDQSLVRQRRAILQKRRDLAYELAQGVFECSKPQGAFYLFANIEPCLRPGETGEELALRLLQTAGVAVVPGEAFHQPGYLRISFGADEADLHAGFERIKNAL